MICFRDTTFYCSPNCQGKCGRQWTADLAHKARKWWGGKDAPIAFSFFCGETENMDLSGAVKQTLENVK